MVLPGEEPLGERVLIQRNPRTGAVLFRDPETGRFISRSSALTRVTYDFERGRIVDSFGNTIGVGAFRLPLAGAVRQTENTVQVYAKLDVDPRQFRAAANQEIIERITVVGRDGKLRTFEIDYGPGGKYDRSAHGGRWRFETSRALGLADNQRAQTTELRQAVAYREFIVRTISYK